MVVIDQERCIGCGKCVQDCVTKQIKLEKGKAQIKNNCILCGHCVAICPVCAPAIPCYDMDDVEEYSQPLFNISSDAFLRAIKFRRSIRNFSTKEIEQEVLWNILQAGRYTETAVNSQDVRFIVLKEELDTAKRLIWEGWRSYASKLIEENNPMGRVFLSYYHAHQKDEKNDRLFFNATVALVVAADYSLDGGLASANMEMMAVSQGLGVLFDGYIVSAINHSKQARTWLGIEKKQIAACFLLGYPDVEYKRTAPRKQADIIWK